MEAIAFLKALNMIQAGLDWLASRGVTRDRAQALLDLAHLEGRDVTDAEVQTELDLLQAELDKTKQAIEDFSGS